MYKELILILFACLLSSASNTTIKKGYGIALTDKSSESCKIVMCFFYNEKVNDSDLIEFNIDGYKHEMKVELICEKVISQNEYRYVYEVEPVKCYSPENNLLFHVVFSVKGFYKQVFLTVHYNYNDMKGFINFYTEDIFTGMFEADLNMIALRKNIFNDRYSGFYICEKNYARNPIAMGYSLIVPYLVEIACFQGNQFYPEENSYELPYVRITNKYLLMIFAINKDGEFEIIEINTKLDTSEKRAR